MKNDNQGHTDKQRSDSLRFVIIAIGICIILCIFNLFTAKAQSHCEKAKLFVAEMAITMPAPLENIDAPTVSIGAGISGIYGKGTVLDNLCAMVGVKWQKDNLSGKNGHSDVLLTIPTATIMYKLRMNGDESTTVHGLSFVTGINSANKVYQGFEYRPYMAPNGSSFATIGGIFGWNNYSGFTVGFTAIGFF